MIGDFLKKEYVKSWEFIKSSRKFIYGIIIVFFAFALVGFFVGFPQGLVNELRVYIQNLLEQTKGFGVADMMGFIFYNNFKAGFTALIFGIAFGIIPLLNAITNGAVLGFVSRLSVQENGAASLWILLPHGIIELVEIFITLGMGLKVGTFIFKRDKFLSLKKYLENSVRVFIFVVLPLLLVAAIIEGILIFLI